MIILMYYLEEKQKSNLQPSIKMSLLEPLKTLL